MRPYRFFLSHLRLFISAFVLISIAFLATNNRAIFSQDKEIIHETPTPVEIGVVTEKQREHSKLYLPYKGRKNLAQLAEEGAGDLEIVGGNWPPLGYGSLSEEDSGVYPNLYLRGISNDADAVVIGIVKDRSAQITGDGTFVFTDYEVAVEEVLKPNPRASSDSINRITVSRPGGTIQLRGRTIRARDIFFKPFKMDSRYLLFLKYVPVTGSYRAFRNGSFLLRDNRSTQLTEDLLWPAMKNGVELNSFLTEARNAVVAAYSDQINGIKRSFRLY